MLKAELKRCVGRGDLGGGRGKGKTATGGRRQRGSRAPEDGKRKEGVKGGGQEGWRKDGEEKGSEEGEKRGLQEEAGEKGWRRGGGGRMDRGKGRGCRNGRDETKALGGREGTRVPRGKDRGRQLCQHKTAGVTRMRAAIVIGKWVEERPSLAAFRRKRLMVQMLYSQTHWWLFCTRTLRAV